MDIFTMRRYVWQPAGQFFCFVKRAPGAVHMTSALMKAKLIRVEFEQGKAGLFYATSPDMKGLLVAELSYEAARSAVAPAIEELYAACGVSVVVSELEENPAVTRESWIAVPTAAISQSIVEL